MIQFCKIKSYRDHKLDLAQEQEKKYFPLYQKLKENFSLDVKKYENIMEEVSMDNLFVLKKLIFNLNMEKAFALEFAASLLKSTSLALLALEGHIEMREAFELSRLEETFQYLNHGKIEEHHDFDERHIFMQLMALNFFWKFS